MGIITPHEAASLLGLSNPYNYPALKIILPAVDDFIKTATGKDWGEEEPPDPTAKMLASALLMRWFDHPESLGVINDNDVGVKSLISQLHAKALILAQEEE